MWKSMTPDEVFTEKFPASLGKHAVGKIIVAGHTGVGPMHAREGRMRAVVAQDRFFEIGSPEGLAALEERLRRPAAAVQGWAVR